MPPAAFTEIAVDGGPNLIAASANAIWVELHRADSLASIDPATNKVRVFPEVDAHCAVAANATSTWSTHAHPGQVTRVDATSGEVVVSTAIDTACGVAVDDSSAYVSSPALSQIMELDPDTGAVRRQLPSPGPDPFVLVSEGDALWAAGEGIGGWLAVIDKASFEITSEWRAPDVPFFDSIAFGFDSAWAVGRLSPSLYRLDPETGEVLGMTAVAMSPSGVVVTPEGVWVSHIDGRVSLIDPESGEVTAVWTMPYTWLVASAYAFGSLWMASLEENAVVRVDPTALAG